MSTWKSTIYTTYTPQTTTKQTFDLYYVSPCAPAFSLRIPFSIFILWYFSFCVFGSLRRIGYVCFHAGTIKNSANTHKSSFNNRTSFCLFFFFHSIFPFPVYSLALFFCNIRWLNKFYETLSFCCLHTEEWREREAEIAGKWDGTRGEKMWRKNYYYI